MNVSIARTLVVLFSLAVCCAPRAYAATDLQALSADQLVQLEQRAEHADHREQCFLFTELVQVYTQLAARQIAQGETEQAGRTLERVRAYVERIHLGLARDTKKLKNAEMILHTASFRLQQFVHRASEEEKPAFEATLTKMDKVHEEMLAQVFAH